MVIFLSSLYQVYSFAESYVLWVRNYNVVAVKSQEFFTLGLTLAQILALPLSS